MKKILYFYPENPLLPNQGNNARALALLQYFRSRKDKAVVDFMGVQEKEFTAADIAKLQEEGLINNGYLLRQFKRKENPFWYFFVFSMPNKIFGKLKQFDRRRLGQQKSFNEIVSQNKYDSIIISYACWAKLIHNNPATGNAQLIVDTHDFLTSQFQNQKDFAVGKYFENEINLLKPFDKVLVISNEEKYIFSQFLKSQVAVITHALPNKIGRTAQTEKKYDVIYVASNNEHNVRSVKWFFEEVYPHLSKNLKIAVVGRITNFFGDYPNVEKFGFVEDLDSFYASSRIAICPMLTGTGLKIKVIEAISYGLPVVCNERGVDGMVNKSNNGCLVTDDAKEFAGLMTELLSDADLYARIGADARNYFAANNDIERVYQKNDAVFELF